jgi:hypothetical protein
MCFDHDLFRSLHQLHESQTTCSYEKGLKIIIIKPENNPFFPLSTKRDDEATILKREELFHSSTPVFLLLFTPPTRADDVLTS